MAVRKRERSMIPVTMLLRRRIHHRDILIVICLLSTSIVVVLCPLSSIRCLLSFLPLSSFFFLCSRVIRFLCYRTHSHFAFRIFGLHFCNAFAFALECLPCLTSTRSLSKSIVMNLSCSFHPSDDTDTDTAYFLLNDHDSL